MPLLQDGSRGRAGGSRENRRSIPEFLGMDSTQFTEPVVAPRTNHQPNECGPESSWLWEEPRSPEGAQSPRALVPPACFPPRNAYAFASFSESARPGVGSWDERHSVTDLVASFKSLALPASPESSHDSHTIQVRLNYEHNVGKPQWPPDASLEYTEGSAPTQKKWLLPRSASFMNELRGTAAGGGVGVAGGAADRVVRWSGALPTRRADAGGYSPKVFLGGLPWDVSEATLMDLLEHFQPIRLEWPGREEGGAGGASPRGFAYVTLGSEASVRALLAASRRDHHQWYYRVPTRKLRTKEVQVIPWAVSDSNWVSGGAARLEPTRTVFVGALHGMLTAPALAHIMTDLFGGVVHAGLDTDKNKYPIGSGRVTFNNVRSYVRAISAGYIEIRTEKFTKKIQVDPYLEDSMCSVCNLQQGPYFCREPVCFRYFCRSCWSWQHAEAGGGHRPLTRNPRGVAPAPGPAPAAPAPGPAHPHSLEHNFYSATYCTPNEGTPSPATSGTSGTSEASPPCEEPHEAAWPQ